MYSDPNDSTVCLESMGHRASQLRLGPLLARASPQSGDLWSREGAASTSSARPGLGNRAFSNLGALPHSWLGQHVALRDSVYRVLGQGPSSSIASLAFERTQISRKTNRVECLKSLEVAERHRKSMKAYGSHALVHSVGLEVNDLCSMAPGQRSSGKGVLLLIAVASTLLELWSNPAGGPRALVVAEEAEDGENFLTKAGAGAELHEIIKPWNDSNNISHGLFHRWSRKLNEVKLSGVCASQRLC